MPARRKKILARISLIVLGMAATLGAGACSALTGFSGLVGDAEGADSATSDAPATSDAGSESDASDASDGAPPGYFFDNFNRADNAVIGNGWIMKSATAFEIRDGAVPNLFENADYQDNIVYRPASEDMRDVLTQVDVTLGASNHGSSCAQLHARIQAATVQKSGVLDDYLTFFGCTSDSLIIFRVNGGQFTSIASTNLSPSLAAGQTVRLALQVTGTNVVSIVATVSNVNADGTTTVLASTSTTDSSSTRIMTAGSVGFSESSGEGDDTYAYDNFMRTPQ